MLLHTFVINGRRIHGQECVTAIVKEVVLFSINVIEYKVYLNVHTHTSLHEATSNIKLLCSSYLTRLNSAHY